MGNSTSRVVGCFVPNAKGGVDLEFSEPLDEGLGHSFCYIRPNPFDSPAITPSNSERFTVDSSTLDSETLSGSFRHDNLEDASNINKPTKGLTETTFRTISGASVSANVSTARTGNQNALFFSDAQEPAASFESTASFASIPLQPIPRGSGPLNNGFMSGPLERGFASGPLDRGGGFMSGPLEGTDQSNFSAPLARGRRVGGLHRLMRSVSGPMKSTISRTFSRNTMGSSWMRRFFLHPVTQFAWQPPKLQAEAASKSCVEIGPSDLEYGNGNDLQWAHGKAGEDRVHVVLSEEQGWLYIGIYDGFSGPDAPDFLMGHLYKAIDKELEGLLWDYDKSVDDDHSKPLINPSSEAASSLINGDKEQSVTAVAESSGSENHNTSISDSCSVFAGNVSSQCRKSMRLYELLQMESKDGQGSEFLSEFVKQRRSSWDFQQNSSAREALEKQQLRSNSVSFKGDDPPSISGENDEIGVRKNGNAADHSVSSQWESTRRSVIGSKIRKMYRKQKSLRKKLFPWNYDWHREETYVDDRMSDQLSGPIRRCVPGTVVDHDVILKALERALQKTEEAYMEMVEKSLDKVPELALMGSCVLVMLMKDQDVYVMNLGDSRVILAQERSTDRIPCSNLLGKDELRHGNRSRESLVRMELDRISEESPMHNQCGQIDKINKNKEISLCKLRIRALQLSTDHCTSIQQEVLRVKSEHSDDNQAIMNDRVKGQLKVTRAFGAGFLKKPSFNAALLEMFRIDYMGTAPYVSCVPSLVHHRLTSTDRFLVLSSDGLYQYFTNEEVVAHVTWFIENVPEGDPAQYLIAELLFRAAQKNGMDFHELLDIPQGDRRKYHDDVSVMVVSLEGRIWRSSG